MYKKRFLLCYVLCSVVFFVFCGIIISKNFIKAPKKEVSDCYIAVFENSNTEKYQSINTQGVSAVLIDAKSGGVLYQKNSDALLPMASTTKIMTALVVLEKMDMDTVVKVPKEATNIEGSSIYLVENEEITIKELMYGLLLESGNDAAVALAISCSGSVKDFVKEMNDKASDMGLIHTNFANPNGLTQEGHYTTAYELAVISKYAMENEIFREIVSTKSITFPEHNRYFSNHNKMLYMYPDTIGIKTGYTLNAGRCLVTCAKRDDLLLIAVTLNDRNDWNDHKNMFEYGFSSYDSVEIAKKGSISISRNGNTYSNTRDIYLTVEKGKSPCLSYSINVYPDNAVVLYFADGIEIGKFYLEKK